MAKAFGDRPRWQRWGIIGGWGFVGLMILGAIAGPDPEPSKKNATTALPDLGQLQAEFHKLAAPCDQAQAAVGAGLGNLASGDRIALARDVRQMGEACKVAMAGLRDLAEPDGTSDAQDTLIKALREDCRTAFYARSVVAEKLMPVVDGDMRPSTMAAIEDEMALMQRDMLRCAGQVAKLAPPASMPADAPSASAK